MSELDNWLQLAAGAERRKPDFTVLSIALLHPSMDHARVHETPADKQLLIERAPNVLALQTWIGLDTSTQRDSAMGRSDVSFASHWHVLGPFQTGTREAAWGADPFELHGGFHALDYDSDASFPSSLAANGTAHWNSTAASVGGKDRLTQVNLTVRFPEVDWKFQQQVYGWAALQWQAWARGEFTVHGIEPATFTFQADSVLEYWIDDEHHWGGDFYETGRAPLVLHLKPGLHRIDLRVIREVRAMGGITDDPRVDLRLQLHRQDSTKPLVQCGSILVSDFITPSSEYKDSVMSAGGFANWYASISLRSNAAKGEITIDKISLQDDKLAEYWAVALVSSEPTVLVPGQSRPVSFIIRSLSYEYVNHIPETFVIRLHYSLLDVGEAHGAVPYILEAEFPVQHRDVYETHKFTYLHPSGIVSYAMLRPPKPNIWKRCMNDSRSIPILLALHGAGVEADSDLSRQSFDGYPDACAWILIPSGVTPWCGDDWHIFAQRDIQAAASAVVPWSQGVGWKGPYVDPGTWVLAGHSNGGQGVWATLLHYPDRIHAAAPVSGYSSIQNYVPYHFWHSAQACKMAVIQSTLETWRHELLLANAKEIPLLQQHGGADDNVPPYHSHLMHQLLPEAEWNSTYHEIPNMPHWWTGVMTTPQLRSFFEAYLPPKYSAQAREHEFYHPTTLDFELVTANPADTDTKRGFKIQLLEVPGRLGRIRVRLDAGKTTVELRTSNVRALRVPDWFWYCKHITIDGQEMNEYNPGKYRIAVPKTPTIPQFDLDGGQLVELVREVGPADPVLDKRLEQLPHLWRQNTRDESKWVLASDSAHASPDYTGEAPSPLTRWGRQLGSIESILRTEGPFNIVANLPRSTIGSREESGEAVELKRLALQVSRNLQTYFYADSVIRTSIDTEEASGEQYLSALRNTGNAISLAIGDSLPELSVAHIDHAIEITDAGTITVKDQSGNAHVYSNALYPGLGAIFLRPLPTERLELVVWGADVAGLRRAARLIPMMTGTGVPDFVLLDGTAAWKGVEGALALGFLDERWNCSVNSFLT
ncbi:hypothetical protein B0A48_15427 [Cryoendolithus antarcticus]|uniref:Peptidase S9 prolyl oligopeptidase catalytic domain-containing protein n=1 Tax=Cryoendolithus antarcticus TaxID=1507870 RepID=A0A1V8SIR5_9PEZI|nr:hypothetical protein B0A48_15427 [Cryoendolithus antarcticus]